MITPTHVVTNAFVARRAAETEGVSTKQILSDGPARRWFVLGGLAPDVGLYALTAGAAMFYPTVRGLSLQETFALAFDDLFFNDPLWIIVQNTLHSPVVLGGLTAVAALTSKKRLLSFALGCLLHTAMDIPVHHDDGPLYLFPFNWSLRFSSPVSYWDPAHYGRLVQPVDMAITLIGGAYLLYAWRRSRRRAGA
ncbi:MAG: hypothetical protein HKN03_01960 [Acidimicrobiales bacterium]|nr:hypothetical protein [Acidimicrobiales bacterium]